MYVSMRFRAHVINCRLDVTREELVHLIGREVEVVVCADSICKTFRTRVIVGKRRGGKVYGRIAIRNLDLCMFNGRAVEVEVRVLLEERGSTCAGEEQGRELAVAVLELVRRGDFFLRWYLEASEHERAALGLVLRALAVLMRRAHVVDLCKSQDIVTELYEEGLIEEEVYRKYTRLRKTRREEAQRACQDLLKKLLHKADTLANMALASLRLRRAGLGLATALGLGSSQEEEADLA